MKRALTISTMLFFTMYYFIADAYGLCTQVSTANLRVGPGTHYEIGWTVSRYMPLKKVGASLSGDWYAVEDVDNAILWIHRSLITAKQSCAVVNTEKVNMRTGPGMQYGKLFLNPVEKYSSFRVLSRKGNWVRLKDSQNNIGWIHGDYLWIQ